MTELSRRGVLGAGLLAVAAGCSRNPSASSDNGFALGDGQLTRIEPDRRKPAPVLNGTDLDGKPLTTAGHEGKVIVLNVWGSWCSPCRHEAPALVEAVRRTAGKASFFGINTRDLDPAPAQSFARAFELNYPSFYDPNGELLLTLRDLPAKAIPSTLLIDGQGRVAARVLGEVTTSMLTGLVDDLGAGK